MTDTTRDEVNSIKTDIALIKRDINQIERIYSKFETTIEQMSAIFKLIAIQEKTIDTQEKKIDSMVGQIKVTAEEELAYRKELSGYIDGMKNDLEKDRQRRHTEIMASLQRVEDKIYKRMDEQEDRVSKLEKWKWYIGGGIVLAGFILTQIPISVSFFD
jgi:chromosome segregation ATPase